MEKGKELSLDREEYLALIDQKAADWRTITQMSTSFLAFAGALFAAGVGQEAAFVVVLSPLPLLFGVYHMVRNAALQLQIVTYLAVFSPFDGASWERDINEVRPRFWGNSPNSKAIAWARAKADGKPLLREAVRAIEHPSAWHVWLVIAVTVGLIVDLIPILAEGYQSSGIAFAAGASILLVGALIVARRAARIEQMREAWVEEWRRYQGELDRDAAPASERQ